MDAFKAQWERILQQLNALTGTQKMLVAALVAVMVMTVLYWGRYAGNAEMVSLLGDQVLTQDDIGPIENQLELRGIPHSVTNLKIMVPAERKGEILANLMFERLLPQDMHSAFETMSKQLNPFSSNSERDATYTEATAMELSSIIGQFPGVSNAKVIINDKNVQRIEGAVHPTATVFLSTKGSPEHERALVRAAADGVAHAVSDLAPTDVSVIVNGISRKAPAADADNGAGSDDLMEIKLRTESHLEQKIREQFRSISDLTVSVTCDVENRTIEMKGVDYDKAKSLVLPIKTITNTEETSTSAASSHEPGVSPNSGANGSASVDGGSAVAAAPNTSTTEHNETENKPFVNTIETSTKTPAGKDTVQAATVGVPTSYFEAVYKKHHPSATTIDDAALDAFTKTEIDKIRLQLKTMLVLKSEDALSVASYQDFTPDLAMAAGPAAQAAALSTVSGHAKEIGVAVLAVISLMMMAMMVRKSAPAPVVLGGISQSGGGVETSSPAARAAMNALLGGEVVAGEVGGGNAALDGMEMDEDAVRTQQMLDQVSTMVKENPDGAAALVKRWLSRA